MESRHFQGFYPKKRVQPLHALKYEDSILSHPSITQPAKLTFYFSPLVIPATSSTAPGLNMTGRELV